MIFASVFNASDWTPSSCFISMLFNTTSDALEISSATSAPNDTIVSRLFPDLDRADDIVHFFGTNQLCTHLLSVHNDIIRLHLFQFRLCGRSCVR